MWRTIIGSLLLLILAATVSAYVRYGHPAGSHTAIVVGIAIAAAVSLALLLWGVATRT